MRPKSLTLPIVAEREDRSGEVIELRRAEVKFRYRAADPFALELDFLAGVDVWVCWSFARDLLTTGLFLLPGDPAVGAGDVQIGPDIELDWRVWVFLSSPTGQARFAFRRRDLDAALTQTEDLVPTGRESERIDWDRELTLLGGRAA